MPKRRAVQTFDDSEDEAGDDSLNSTDGEISVDDHIVIKSAMRYMIIQTARKQTIERANLNKYLKEAHADLGRNKATWLLGEVSFFVLSYSPLHLGVSFVQ